MAPLEDYMDNYFRTNIRMKMQKGSTRFSTAASLCPLPRWCSSRRWCGFCCRSIAEQWLPLRLLAASLERWHRLAHTSRWRRRGGGRRWILVGRAAPQAWSAGLETIVGGRASGPDGGDAASQCVAGRPSDEAGRIADGRSPGSSWL
jgi:hypothetical protein